MVLVRPVPEVVGRRAPWLTCSVHGDDLNLGTSSTDDRVVVPFISRQGKHNKPRRRQALTRVCIVLTTLTNITAIFDRPRRIDYQALTK